MAEHTADDHQIDGNAAEQFRAVLARHLCGWITGHAGPDAHFLSDADMIMEETYAHGLRITWAQSLTGEPAPVPSPASDQSPSRQHPDEPAMREPQP